MNKISIIAIFFALSGCAANSKVTPIGPNRYLITKQAATGFSGAGTLKTDAITEAGEYCANEKQNLNVIEANQNEGPYIFGKYPRAEVTFECR